MFFWLLGASFAGVWWVFRSPALDYRLVMAGAVLPLLEVVLGGPKVLHTLLASVVVLTVVMLATRHRRLVRRQLIAIPIGLFLNLALGGAWADSSLFWWPFFGTAFPSTPLPELSHGVAVTLVLEALGIGALVWCYSAFELGRPDHRERFLRTGQLDRRTAGEVAS